MSMLGTTRTAKAKSLSISNFHAKEKSVSHAGREVRFDFVFLDQRSFYWTNVRFSGPLSFFGPKKFQWSDSRKALELLESHVMHVTQIKSS